MAQKLDDLSPRSPDTANNFMVVARGRLIAMMRPPIAGAALMPEQAANLAAWLAALVICSSPGGRDLFDRTLAAVLRT
jgi:hypothetical protein